MKLFELFGEIKLDDKGTIKTMDDVDKKGESVGKRFGSMANSVGKAGLAVGTFATLAGGAMLGFANKTAETLDRVDKMSQKMNMSAETFQQWDFIASQTGTSMESLSMGMKTFNMRVDELSTGTGIGAEAMERLGMSYEQVKELSPEQQFEATITKLQQMEDVTARNAIASDLFGRAGQELIPILNSESGSIDELKQRAGELGLVQSDEMVKAGAAFADSLDETTRMLKGMATEVAANLLPIVNNFLVWVKESMPQIREFFTNAFNAIQPVITNMYTMFRDNILPILKSLFGWVMDNMPIFKETFMTIFDAIWTVVNSVWELFEISLLPILKLLFNWVDENMETIGDVIGGTFEVISSIIETTIGVIDDVITTLKNAYDWATKTIKKIQKVSSERAKEREEKSSGGFYDVKGMRANGGPVSAGESYIVGEKEAELFVPRQDGMIYNQKQMAAMGGGSIVVNINNAKAFNTRDIDNMGEMIVNALRRKGIKPNG